MVEPLDLSLRFIENHPVDAAKILESLPPSKTCEFLFHIDEQYVVKVMARLVPEYAANCFAQLPLDRSLQLVRQLETQPVVDIFRYLTPSIKNRLLNQMPLSKRLAVQTLNKYSQNSVGAWLSADYISVGEDRTIEDVIELIQESEQRNQEYVYVVNAKKQFVSAVNTFQLLKAGLKARISSIRGTSEISLSARSSIQDVCAHDAWKHYTMLPVIEHDRRLVGVLSYSDLMEALEKSQIEFNAQTASIGNEVLNLYWAVFNNFVQLLSDFYSMICWKK